MNLGAGYKLYEMEIHRGSSQCFNHGRGNGRADVPVAMIGQEPGNVPETKAPAPVQATPAPAAAPALSASGHPLNDYWTAHDKQMLTDFAWLARFKEADLALVPGPGENRVVFMGDSITQGWKIEGRTVVSRQAVCQSRHQRTNHAADGLAFSPGRDRFEAKAW